MPPSIENEIRDCFPELQEIKDEKLREKVVLIWTEALQESDFTVLNQVPWSATFFPVVGPDETQITHVREVTAGVLAYADAIENLRPSLTIDRDLLIAGSLLHDISKFFEVSSPETDDDRMRTELEHFLPHPHYGIHLAAKADLPLEIINMVAGHTENSNIQPRTLEAKILESVDLLVTETVVWEKTGKFVSEIDI